MAVSVLSQWEEHLLFPCVEGLSATGCCGGWLPGEWCAHMVLLWVFVSPMLTHIGESLHGGAAKERKGLIH